ncbi:MAG TPA: DUF533 domain-containing protein, partial [Steroidobacteraceae bacterium]
MLDPKLLLEKVLGSQGADQIKSAGQTARGRLDAMTGSQGFATGAVAGGLLGLLIGSKKVRKMAGGALGYGGAAVLGALAYRAYQNYRQQQAAHTITPAEISDVSATQLPHTQPAAGGGSFELVLIEAMVAAAKADGHIDAEEQRRLFSEVERLGLDAESKACVFDLLAKPVDLSKIASSATTPEQASE